MGISGALSGVLDAAKSAKTVISTGGKKLVDNSVDFVKSTMKNNDINLRNIEGTASSSYKKWRTVRDSKVDDIVYSIDKGLGRNTAKVIAGAEGIAESVAKTAGKYGYKVGKKAITSTIKTPIKNPDKFLGYEFGLTGLGTAAFIGAYGVYPVAKATVGAYERSNYGEIEGDTVANSVNETYTPAGNLFEAAQTGAINQKRFNKQVMNDNVSAKLAGVNPEIVFAMHTLRNSKNMLGNEGM